MRLHGSFPSWRQSFCRLHEVCWLHKFSTYFVAVASPTQFKLGGIGDL